MASWQVGKFRMDALPNQILLCQNWILIPINDSAEYVSVSVIRNGKNKTQVLVKLNRNEELRRMHCVSGALNSIPIT